MRQKGFRNVNATTGSAQQTDVELESPAWQPGGAGTVFPVGSKLFVSFSTWPAIPQWRSCFRLGRLGAGPQS
jgi:hypothetical protein